MSLTPPDPAALAQLQSRELQDALTLLKQIAAPCDGAPSDHGWRKCKRCIAIHGLTMRFGLSMRLLDRAIQELEARP